MAWLTSHWLPALWEDLESSFVVCAKGVFVFADFLRHRYIRENGLCLVPTNIVALWPRKEKTILILVSVHAFDFHVCVVHQNDGANISIIVISHYNVFPWLCSVTAWCWCKLIVWPSCFWEVFFLVKHRQSLKHCHMPSLDSVAVLRC